VDGVFLEVISEGEVAQHLKNSEGSVCGALRSIALEHHASTAIGAKQCLGHVVTQALGVQQGGCRDAAKDGFAGVEEGVIVHITARDDAAALGIFYPEIGDAVGAVAAEASNGVLTTLLHDVQR